MRSLCIGSAMVDIIVLVADRDVERMTMHNATSSFLLLEQGRKIESLGISNHIGGGAVNAAVSMARLGLETGVLVKLGNDQNGELILERLNTEGVDAAGVIHTDELPTGTAVMVSSHNRNATIFTQRGANTLLSAADIAGAELGGRDLVYVAALSGNSADRFAGIVESARAGGAFVAANPGIRQLSTRTASIMKSLGNIDLMAINRIEAEALVPAVTVASDVGGPPEGEDDGDEIIDGPRLIKRGLINGGFRLDILEFFTRLREAGVGRTLVTDGTQGAYLSGDSGVHHCPSLKVEVMGTAGAGDAFTSTLSGLLASGEETDTALRAATVNATSVVSEVDTQGGLLRRDELTQRIRGHAAELAISHWPWPG